MMNRGVIIVVGVRGVWLWGGGKLSDDLQVTYILLLIFRALSRNPFQKYIDRDLSTLVEMTERVTEKAESLDDLYFSDMIKGMRDLLMSFLVLIALVLGGCGMLNNDSSDEFGEGREELVLLDKRQDLAIATFSGGCFWCMEGPFESMGGVAAAVSGYTGGKVENPTYENVLSGNTGHRESVQVYYDPEVVTFVELLETYWLQVDPTDPDGQFADRGEHYTTAVYYRNSEEKEEIERQIVELEALGRLEGKVVTAVLPFTTFYPAEDYHQDFYKKSAEHYKRYVKGSGRADYVEAAKRWYEESNR